MRTSIPTFPQDVGEVVRTSSPAPLTLEWLPAHRDVFAEAVAARVRAPLDYVRPNISAVH